MAVIHCCRAARLSQGAENLWAPGLCHLHRNSPGQHESQMRDLSGRQFLCYEEEVKGELPCCQEEVTVTGTVSPYTSHASVLSLGYRQFVAHTEENQYFVMFITG